jgi:glycerol-3-phosphate acyltransferase PlsX
LFGEIKSITKQSLKTKLGALMLKKHLYGLKRKYDHKKVGGAPLLGVTKIVLKCHGNSKAESVCATINQAFTLGKNKLVEKVLKAVSNEEK